MDDDKPGQPDDPPRPDVPAPGTAGRGNTGTTDPAIEGGQPAVGDEDVRETRNTEF